MDQIYYNYSIKQDDLTHGDEVQLANGDWFPFIKRRKKGAIELEDDGLFFSPSPNLITKFRRPYTEKPKYFTYAGEEPEEYGLEKYSLVLYWSVAESMWINCFFKDLDMKNKWTFAPDEPKGE
jgi:hypothetical protein